MIVLASNLDHLGSALVGIAIVAMVLACAVGYRREQRRAAPFDASLQKLRTPGMGDVSSVPDLPLPAQREDGAA